MFAKPFLEEFYLILSGNSLTIIRIGNDKIFFCFPQSLIHMDHLPAMTERIFHQVVEHLLKKRISENLCSVMPALLTETLI